MDSLPHWDALSEAARTRLMQGVDAMLAADARSMPRVGDAAVWGELLAAGVVVQVAPGADAVGLTGPGASLVLDVMEAAYAEGALVAA